MQRKCAVFVTSPRSSGWQRGRASSVATMRSLAVALTLVAPVSPPTDHAREGLPGAGGRRGAARLAAPAVRTAGLGGPLRAPVQREFDYDRGDPFRAGQHRGVDFAARPGAVVRAACSGAVATARARVVTVRCGAWRVTHLPLAAIAVRAGERVRAGAPLGRLGTLRGHAGLHLGVRRAGDRLAYVDPLPLLRARRPPAHPVARRGPRPTTPPRATTPPLARPAGAQVRAPLHAAPPPLRTSAPSGASVRAPVVAAPLGAPVPAAVAAGVRVSSGAGAPWPAWVGLAVLLLGVVGGGVRIGVRRRGAAVAAPLPR